MKKQLLSFWYAIRGIGGAFRTEAHLRFHLVAAVFVLIFAGICGFCAERFAILLTLIGLVFALELVNTAIEHACNAVTRDFHPQIKLAKDLAAGAVLAAAICAAAVAVVFFLNAQAWQNAAAFFQTNPLAIIPLVVLAAVCALFVIFGGKKKK